VQALHDDDKHAIHNALRRACDHGLGEERFAYWVGYAEVVALPQGRTPPQHFIAANELEGKLEEFHAWREPNASEDN
jgi:hypothetical protein